MDTAVRPFVAKALSAENVHVVGIQSSWQHTLRYRLLFQYTLAFALRRHLSRPWCPACKAVLYCCIAVGTRTCSLPFRKTSSSMDNSSQSDQYGFSTFGSFLSVSGHPLTRMSRNGASTGSRAVSSRSCLTELHQDLELSRDGDLRGQAFAFAFAQ